MKRKAMLSIFVLTVFVLLLCFNVSAESGFKVDIEVTGEMVSGETFDAVFSVTDITEANGLAGVCFTVKYDTVFLEAVSISPNLPEEWKNSEDFNETVKNEDGTPKGKLVLGASAYDCAALKNSDYSITVTFKCIKDGDTVITVDEADEVFGGVTLKDGIPFEVSGDGCEKKLEIEKSKVSDISGSGEASKENNDGAGTKYKIFGVCAVAVAVAVAAAIIIKRKKRK